MIMYQMDVKQKWFGSEKGMVGLRPEMFWLYCKDCYVGCTPKTNMEAEKKLGKRETSTKPLLFGGFSRWLTGAYGI